MSSLQIAGLVKLSSVDWPGKLTATVFCQGCPWRCIYCHNQDLLDPLTPGTISWGQVTEFLSRRHGLLDGVVFSGGEALRQRGVIDCAAEVAGMGFEVGLHTGGAYPSTLSSILPHTSWVGLDIKALPEDYPLVAGTNAGHKAWQSLDILLASRTDYEVRTTVHPGSPAATRLPQILDRLRKCGVTSFALQEARLPGTSSEFRSLPADSWDSQWDELCDMATSAGFDSVAIRSAT